MRLSYVTVCVNYLDYLRVAMHHNVAQFDDYVVVTSLGDFKTINWLQSQPYITPVYTDAFYRNGATFNKGLALNEGLNALQSLCKPEWVAIMDADTFVPPDWREQLQRANLDKEWLYGARRVLLPTWADYERLWKDDIESFDSMCGFGWLQLFYRQRDVVQNSNLGAWYDSYNTWPVSKRKLLDMAVFTIRDKCPS